MNLQKSSKKHLFQYFEKFYKKEKIDFK